MTPEQLCRAGTEDGHQSALFCWANQMIKIPWHRGQLDLLFAIPNGGARSKATAARLKATGVRTGVPDIFLPIAMFDKFGLFIELKRPATVGKREGVTSKAQDDYIERLRWYGYTVEVCVGWQQAAKAIAAYLEGTTYDVLYEHEGSLYPLPEYL